MAAVVVREVWRSNLAQEFRLIQECLREFRLVSIDTEFPGTVFTFNNIAPHHVSFSSLSPDQHYSLMRDNVNALNIIQIGLTLSDDSGNDLRAWEFNFRDFDADTNLNNSASIALLRAKGIDFSENKRSGIDSREFASLFHMSGLASGRAWLTFHGLYDFGFLIKILIGGGPLPDDLGEFMGLLRHFLGVQVYDLKSIGRALGLHGGLEKVAGSLGLERAIGRSHRAGSDSLLTMQAFLRLLAMNAPCTVAMLRGFNYMLYGLTSN